MFGRNPIRSITHNPLFLAVEEVFYTIQGEGPFTGRPALFIRMSGCNLACHFCDTQFEKNAENVRSWQESVDEIQKFTPQQREFVVLTGGEPLRQNVSLLVQELLNTGTKLIQIETAGTLWQEDLRPFIESGHVVLVCSPKTPGINPSIKLYCQHWKYIVMFEDMPGVDGLPGVGTQPGNRNSFQVIYRPPARIGQTIWVSPCDEYDPDKNKINQQIAVNLCLKHGYRLSLQVHKIINLP